MNPHDTPAQRLDRNRAQARRWLERDQSQRTAFKDSGLGQLTSLPWLRQLTAHPVASMALGTLARWWMRPRPTARSSSPTVGMLAAGAGLGLLRRRPLLTVVTAAAVVAVLLWKKRARRSPPIP